MFNDISTPTAGRNQRVPRADNISQQQNNQNLPQQPNNNNNSAQQYSAKNNTSSTFLKTRARFNKYNQHSQDDDTKMQALQETPLQRTTRSHSQPAVHHLHNMNNGELQQPTTTRWCHSIYFSY